MNVFLDFEASSLAKNSYPIEVGWVFEDGRGEAHLIRPLPDWTDWSDHAQALHGITRATLLAEGEAPVAVAGRMMAELAAHDLHASAPSWDGKWLSILLRAAGLPRHALRLVDTDEAIASRARAWLGPRVAPEKLDGLVRSVVVDVHERARSRHPRHRALPDAEQERQHWLGVDEAAADALASLGP